MAFLERNVYLPAVCMEREITYLDAFKTKHFGLFSEWSS